AEVGPYAVRLIDTPGLGEVGDEARARVATDAAKRADLVLFVAAEDLTASARGALAALREAGKPMLLALNKMDLLEPGQQAEVLASVRGRLPGVVRAEDVVRTAAAPVVRERVVGPDGQARLEVRRGAPRIEALEARLVAAIAEAAPDLKDLAAAAEQVEQHLA